MIDYEVLCQTIEDWRAGRRPSIDLSAVPAAGYPPPEQYAEEAGLEEQGYQQEPPQYADDAGYEQVPADQSYEQLPAEPVYDDQAQYAEEGYEQAPPVPEAGYEQVDEGYDPGAPDQQVESGGTDPIATDDLDPQV